MEVPLSKIISQLFWSKQAWRPAEYAMIKKPHMPPLHKFVPEGWTGSCIVCDAELTAESFSHGGALVVANGDSVIGVCSHHITDESADMAKMVVHAMLGAAKRKAAI